MEPERPPDSLLYSVPDGQRTIAPIAIYVPRVEGGKLDQSATWDLDASGNLMPFADKWQSVVGRRMDEWFGAYKQVGGMVDVVMLDLEAMIFGFGHVFAKGNQEANRKIFAAWESDPRWPSLLGELNAYGAGFNITFDNMTAATDTACCNSGGCQPGCDTSQMYYPVWNAVMDARVARMLNESLYRPIAKHFPNIELSNYGKNTVFLSSSKPNMSILPRQARDNHRETQKQTGFSQTNGTTIPRPVTGPASSSAT